MRLRASPSVAIRYGFVALLGYGPPGSTSAQQTFDVRSSSCSACRIELEPAGAFSTNGRLDAIVSSKDRFYLTSLETRDVVEIFDRTGTRLGEIGRRGGGPGEFQSILGLVATDDELQVLDAGTGRRSVFGSDHQLLWTAPLPYNVNSAAAFDRGVAIINASIASAALAGIPLHVVDSAGRVVRSFGDDSEPYRYDRRFSGERAIARGANGTVWVAHKTRYVLEQWDLSGKRLRTIRRHAAWFPPVEQWDFPDAGGPAPSLIMDIGADQKGRILVLSVVADPNWRKALQTTTGAHAGRRLPDPDRYDTYWDTIIEVFDVKSGRLLISRRLDSYISDIVDAGTIAGPAQSPGGMPTVRIWNIVLDSE